MPDALVLGKICPGATGLMRCLSTMYMHGWRTAREEDGRTDVCALPSGISVPQSFVVTFVIMCRLTLKTGDPMKGCGGRNDVGLIRVSC